MKQKCGMMGTGSEEKTQLLLACHNHGATTRVSIPTTLDKGTAPLAVCHRFLIPLIDPRILFTVVMRKRKAKIRTFDRRFVWVSLKDDGPTVRRARRRAREEVARRRIGSLKDDGPTGQTTGQRGSDPSAFKVSISGYYNII